MRTRASSHWGSTRSSPVIEIFGGYTKSDGITTTGPRRRTGVRSSRRNGTRLHGTLMRSRSERTWKSGRNLNPERHWVCVYLNWNMRTQLTNWHTVFDNWRMLHGRSQFVGKRRMCGGYGTCIRASVGTHLDWKDKSLTCISEQRRLPLQIPPPQIRSWKSIAESGQFGQRQI